MRKVINVPPSARVNPDAIMDVSAAFSGSSITSVNKQIPPSISATVVNQTRPKNALANLVLTTEWRFLWRDQLVNSGGFHGGLLPVGAQVFFAAQKVQKTEHRH